MNFGKKIKELRLQRTVTQEQFATFETHGRASSSSAWKNGSIRKAKLLTNPFGKYPD